MFLKKGGMTMTKRKSVRLFAFIVLALVPVIVYIVWTSYNHYKIFSIRSGKDVTISTIPRKSAANPESYPAKIVGTYGNLFDPHYKNNERQYDVIVLSAVLNPVVKVNNSESVLLTNRLVGSFFANAYKDQLLTKSGLENLVIRMTQSITATMIKNNKEFLQYFTKDPKVDIDKWFDKNRAADLCEPYIAEVPRKSELYKRERIRWYAVIPLFDTAELLNKNIDPEEIKKRLSYDVIASTYRVIEALSASTSIANNKDKVYNIAFPAIAGVEKTFDSSYFLNYSTSFQSIAEGIEGCPGATNFDNFYLVVWNELHYKPIEEEAALKGLESVYQYFVFSKNEVIWLSYLLFVIFFVEYIIEFFYLYSLKKKSIHSIIVAFVLLLGTSFFIFLNLKPYIVRLLLLFPYNQFLIGVILIGAGTLSVFLAKELAMVMPLDLLKNLAKRNQQENPK